MRLDVWVFSRQHGVIAQMAAVSVCVEVITIFIEIHLHMQSPLHSVYGYIAASGL